MKLDHVAIDEAMDQLDRWAQKCHSASLHLVRSGVLPPTARVARGRCSGVMGQHSWVVVGDDVYAPDAQIVDPTLWSYDPDVSGIWYGSARDGRHRPHGTGLIWNYGRPGDPTGPIVRLTPKVQLSRRAAEFLAMLEPLDYNGWSVLAHAPVEGWPSDEILAAIDDTDALTALVPIDVLGMVTDRNPGGLYR